MAAQHYLFFGDYGFYSKESTKYTSVNHLLILMKNIFLTFMTAVKRQELSKVYQINLSTLKTGLVVTKIYKPSYRVLHIYKNHPIRLLHIPLTFRFQLTTYWTFQIRFYTSLNLKELQSLGSLKLKVHKNLVYVKKLKVLKV